MPNLGGNRKTYETFQPISRMVKAEDIALLSTLYPQHLQASPRAYTGTVPQCCRGRCRIEWRESCSRHIRIIDDLVRMKADPLTVCGGYKGSRTRSATERIFKLIVGQSVHKTNVVDDPNSDTMCPDIRECLMIIYDGKGLEREGLRYIGELVARYRQEHWTLSNGTRMGISAKDSDMERKDHAAAKLLRPV
ncbi:hypothetical protein C8J55DRAFT_491542 [Lentinula edodes]|uniref:Uncharacterized protein n=1 Tax=Lentinula lateritia TaxID=40482 RepID=A0A9W9DIE8_9AGAR|nr:hypothetical protein C8J55DRAFT_491542 [Lentinula edodes]